MVVFFKKGPKAKTWEKNKGTYSEPKMEFLERERERERERDFSLNFRQIRPSELVGTRRKVALRIKAYAWAPVLRSFDKLCEVGVSSYLFYTLCKCFVMFELV